MSEFEVVERPKWRPARYGKWNAIGDALAETLITGQAVRVPLEGRSPSSIGYCLTSNVSRRHHLVVRYRSDGDHLICWAEKREEK